MVGMQIFTTWFIGELTDLLFVFSFSGEQREGEREAAGDSAVSRQVRKVRMLSPGGKLRCGCWTPSTPTQTSLPLPHWPGS